LHKIQKWLYWGSAYFGQHQKNLAEEPEG